MMSGGIMDCKNVEKLANAIQLRICMLERRQQRDDSGARDYGFPSSDFCKVFYPTMKEESLKHQITMLEIEFREKVLPFKRWNTEPQEHTLLKTL